MNVRLRRGKFMTNKDKQPGMVEFMFERVLTQLIFNGEKMCWWEGVWIINHTSTHRRAFVFIF